MDLFAREFQDGELDRNHAVTCELPRQHIDTLLDGGLRRRGVPGSYTALFGFVKGAFRAPLA